MRTFLTLSLVALPLIAPHALEAVAQSPAGAGSGAGAENLATQGTLLSLQAQNQALGQLIVQQQQIISATASEIAHIKACATQSTPAVWNGTQCVTVGKNDGPPPKQPALKWQSMTSSRKLGDTYVNATDHPIEISVMNYSNKAGLSCAVSLTIDGVLAGYQFMNNNLGAAMCMANATVPSGSHYMANNDGWAHIYLYSWSELR